MAGHAVIKVFAGFAAIATIAPVSVVAIVAMYGLEILVAFIQAYVFTILTCVYLKDALHPSHWFEHPLSITSNRKENSSWKVN